MAEWPKLSVKLFIFTQDPGSNPARVNFSELTIFHKMDSRAGYIQLIACWVIDQFLLQHGLIKKQHFIHFRKYFTVAGESLKDNELRITAFMRLIINTHQVLIRIVN